MDPRDEHRMPRAPEGSQPGDRVGLGRVVENAAGMGEAPPTLRTGERPLVDDASADSFPASDPPDFMTEPATPRDPDRVEPPDPRDVP